MRQRAKHACSPSEAEEERDWARGAEELELLEGDFEGGGFEETGRVPAEESPRTRET
jgi:hypothetical protein